MRRHSRTIPRSDGAIQNWRQISGHQLPLYGRLRRSRLLLSGDSDAARRAQGALQGTNNDLAWQPRVKVDHTGLRFLRRVLAQVRERERVEDVHRPL